MMLIAPLRSPCDALFLECDDDDEEGDRKQEKDSLVLLVGMGYIWGMVGGMQCHTHCTSLKQPTLLSIGPGSRAMDAAACLLLYWARLRRLTLSGDEPSAGTPATAGNKATSPTQYTVLT